MISQHALYRYFDEADRLLYIGKTGALAERNSTHIKRSDWMLFAVRSTFERHPGSERLGEAERAAIAAEHPIFNRQHNDTPEAQERLRVYLVDVGRPDLIPARLRIRIPAPLTDQDALADATGEDILDLLRQILTANTADHAKVRLWALAAMEGYADLPRGAELERIADLGQLGRGTAYKARRIPLPPPLLSSAG